MDLALNMREYKEGDEQAIVNLLDIVFGAWSSKGGLNYWKWLYKDNPAGRPIIRIAEYDKKVVGHYAIFPVRMKVREGCILGSQSVDTAVHPEYRGRGIFKTLASKVYAEAGKSGIPLTYGFTDIKMPAYKGFTKKLGWKHICLMTLMTNILNPEKTLKKYFTRNRLLLSLGKLFLNTLKFFKSMFKIFETHSQIEDLKIHEVRRFDERINALWTKLSKMYDLIVIRDKTYLNWRYVDKPDKYILYIAERKDKILGYAVLKETINGNFKKGFMVDIMAPANHDEVIAALIAKAMEHFKERNVDLVECQLIKSHPYCKILKKAGFLALRSTSAFIIHIKSQQIGLTDLLSLDIKKWFITYGDGDYV